MENGYIHDQGGDETMCIIVYIYANIYIMIYIYYLTLDDPLIYNIYMDNVYIYMITC